MTQTETREDHGLANALAWFQSIKEMVDALEGANARAMEHAPTADGNYDEENEDARQRIQESVLSVEVRSGWYSPAGGNADSAPAEYRILLTTGGPACQLVGELNEHGEPETAYLEHQDWGTPWTEVSARQLAFASDKEAHTGESYNEGMERQAKGADEAQTYLLTFARQFYFGEG